MRLDGEQLFSYHPDWDALFEFQGLREARDVEPEEALPCVRCERTEVECLFEVSSITGFACSDTTCTAMASSQADDFSDPDVYPQTPVSVIMCNIVIYKIQY